MPGIVLTFPILPGKVEAWRRFCQELAGSRSTLYETSRRRLGITHEQMALLETVFGATSVTRLEARNIGRMLIQIMTSDLPFDRWYRERLEDLHGVTLTHYQQFSQPAPASVPPELLFEWGLPRSSSN